MCKLPLIPLKVVPNTKIPVTEVNAHFPWKLESIHRTVQNPWVKVRSCIDSRAHNEKNTSSQNSEKLCGWKPCSPGHHHHSGVGSTLAPGLTKSGCTFQLLGQTWSRSQASMGYLHARPVSLGKLGAPRRNSKETFSYSLNLGSEFFLS